MIYDLLSDEVEERETSLRQVIALLLVRLYVLRKKRFSPVTECELDAH